MQDVYATQINENAAIRLAIDRTTQCGTSSVEKKICNTLMYIVQIAQVTFKQDALFIFDDFQMATFKYGLLDFGPLDILGMICPQCLSSSSTCCTTNCFFAKCAYACSRALEMWKSWRFSCIQKASTASS